MVNDNNTINHDDTMGRALSIRAAYDAGRAWALGLKVGDKFYGASVANPEPMFVYGAMDVLEKMVVCVDADGVLTRYEAGR